MDQLIILKNIIYLNLMISPQEFHAGDSERCELTGLEQQVITFQL